MEIANMAAQSIHDTKEAIKGIKKTAEQVVTQVVDTISHPKENAGKVAKEIKEGAKEFKKSVSKSVDEITKPVADVIKHPKKTANKVVDGIKDNAKEIKKMFHARPKRILTRPRTN